MIKFQRSYSDAHARNLGSAYKLDFGGDINHAYLLFIISKIFVQF